MKHVTAFTLIALGIIGVVLYQLAPHATDYADVTNFPPKGWKIVALGDSLTVGVGASSHEKGFVPLLEKRLGVSIEGAGVSGNTTKDALGRLDADVLVKNPDIVIVLLGGNDYLRRIPEEETFNNILEITRRIQARGAVVLLLGIRGGLLSDHWEKNFTLIADDAGTAYVPNVLDDIFGDPTLMSDHIHPNDRGYEKIADKVAPILIKLVSSSHSIATEALPTRE